MSMLAFYLFNMSLMKTNDFFFFLSKYDLLLKIGKEKFLNLVRFYSHLKNNVNLLIIKNGFLFLDTLQ